MTGKSSFGKRRELERGPTRPPPSAARQPHPRSALTSAPSGSLRTISCRVTARPWWRLRARPGRRSRSTTSMSRSVARKLAVIPRPRSARWRGSGWCCAARRPTAPERQRAEVRRVRWRVSCPDSDRSRERLRLPCPPASTSVLAEFPCLAAPVNPKGVSGRAGRQASSMRRRISASSAIWLSTCISSSILRTP
jgi:hypothetical protein